MADSSDIRNFPRFRPGDTLGHHHINGLVDAFKGLEVRGIGVRQDGNKIQILTPTQGRTVSLAISNSTISAMSGMTPVKGSASLQFYNQDDNLIEDTHEDVDIYNVARTSSFGNGIIRSGQMCLVFWLPDGTPILTPIEC